MQKNFVWGSFLGFFQMSKNVQMSRIGPFAFKGCLFGVSRVDTKMEDSRYESLQIGKIRPEKWGSLESDF